jgi:hypothetical protein
VCIELYTNHRNSSEGDFAEKAHGHSLLLEFSQVDMDCMCDLQAADAPSPAFGSIDVNPLTGTAPVRRPWPRGGQSLCERCLASAVL